MSAEHAVLPLPSQAPPARRVARLAAMVLPTVPGVIFAVALVRILFIAQGYGRLFGDSDAGWHIRVGEWMLRTHTVPRTDWFSYTRFGRQWFDWEWLADVLLGGAHHLAGLAGVALLAGLLIALVAWGVVRLALSLGGNLFFAAASAILLLSLTSLHWLARPHIFSWGLALAFVAIAEHERRGLKLSRMLYATPVLACLWANLHGSFLLGPAILFIYGAGEVIAELRAHFATRVTAENAKLAASIRRERRFFLASLLSLAATFINPYGWQLHRHVAAYLRDSYLMNIISEFASYNFHEHGAIYVEVFLLVAVAGMFALLRQQAYGPALLSLALLHGSLYSARHLPVAAATLLPLAVAALSRESERYGVWRRFHAFSARMAAVDREVYGLIPLVCLIALCVLGLAAAAQQGRVVFDPAVFPARAAAWIESRPGGRVFTSDQWGGYLIYRFDGRRKVFIDGRSDFYGDELAERYGTVLEIRPGWQQVLDQENVRYVLMGPESPLTSALSVMPGWKRMYTDSVAAVFERKD